jgi:hypothetical protein
MERVAQCQCEQLRVVVTGDPDRVYLCHCRACQRRTGTFAHLGAYYPRAQVQPEGVDKIYSRLGDSGGTVNFHFCPNCGSTVWWEAAHSTEMRGVAVGCFADPTFPAPTYSVYEEVIHPWVALPASVRDRFDTIRPRSHVPSRPWRSD